MKNTLKTNMKISVSNYGPIAKAEGIELCPLTVFVGPSNTGKSYLAVLIYALCNSFEVGHRFPSLRYSRAHRSRVAREDLKGLDEVVESTSKNINNLFTKLFKNKKARLQFSDLPEELQQWANKHIVNAISKAFHREVARCIGTSTPADSLTGNQFKFTFEDNEKIFTLKAPDETSSLKIKNLSFDLQELSRFPRQIIIDRDIPDELKKEIFLDILRNFFDFLIRTKESFYLPAARTGIMQSHRVITSALLRRATSAGLEAISVPTLSGVLSDFIEEIILMDTKRRVDTNVKKIADAMETNILHGTVKIEDSQTTQYPQLLYKQKDLEIPLLRSSSMVSELAPIVLFLRHRVKKGDLLIIEEPESHLHPAAQKNIAEAIVHLIRVGVRVMVTTHSDYFLEQLANHVRKTKLQESKAEKLTGVGFLKEEEIGAYVFNQKKKGTIVERLHFDQESGFSPEDHNKVSSALYNETIEILDKLDQPK